MDKQYEQVKEFHTACGVEMPDKPTILDIGCDDEMGFYLRPLKQMVTQLRGDKEGGAMYFRTSLLLEELVEFMEADTIEDQADALIDLVYFILGTFTLMGLKPEPIFNIVQAANMAKVGPNGKVIRNEQGKILKPAGWKSPEDMIKAEIKRQEETNATTNG